MSVETFQDESSGLWGYTIYNDGKPVGGSNAIYDSAAEARREGYAEIAESDMFF